MATVQQLEAALLKAHKAGDTRGAKAIAAEIKRVRALPTAKPGRTASAVKGFLSGAADVPVTVGEYLVKGLGAIGLVPDSENVLARSRAGTAQSRAGLEPYRQANPNYFLGGEILGQTVASAPLISGAGGLIARGGGAVVARGAPRVGQTIQNIGKAVQTGGVGAGRTAAQTAALTKGQRAAQIAQRTAGGAIAGGGASALTGQDISEGATFGAGLPVVASVLRRLGGKVADITKVPRIKAAEIIRQSLENNVDEARAAFADLSPDDKRLAEQVLIEAGVEPRTFFGLGKIAEERISPTPFAVTREAQDVAREARLAEAAGGTSMEDIRAAARAGRKAVTKEMEPTREEMYRRSGYASEFVPEKMAEAADLEDLAAAQSAQARRMTLGSERAETALGQMDDLGDIFSPENVARQRGLAGAMTARGEKAAKTAITARERAKDIYEEIDDMAAEGLRPMRAADLIAPLREKLADPEIAVDTLESNTIRGVIRKLEAATDQNGMLNPRALGKIMRSGIGDLVEIWSKKVSSGAAPSSGTLQRGQSLGLEMRDMIKDMLRQGGAGDLVDEFFQRSERGYAAVNRGELAGEAFRMYKQDPTAATEFRALVKGDRPKVVSKIMGGGPENESFTGAFAEDPARLAALQQSAREMETLNRMTALRGQGSGAAANLMVSEQPSRLARGLAAALFSRVPSVRIGVGGAEQTEQAFMAPRVQRELANAFLSGQNARNLIDLYPSSLRASEELSKLPPGMRNAIAQLAQRYALGNQEY